MRLGHRNWIGYLLSTGRSITPVPSNNIISRTSGFKLVDRDTGSEIIYR